MAGLLRDRSTPAAVPLMAELSRSRPAAWSATVGAGGQFERNTQLGRSSPKTIRARYTPFFAFALCQPWTFHLLAPQVRCAHFLACWHPMAPPSARGRTPPLNLAARHDAPAAPARFVGRKLREGREVRNAIRTGFAAKMGRYKNYEKLREIFQIDGYDELGDFLGDSVL